MQRGSKAIPVLLICGPGPTDIIPADPKKEILSLLKDETTRYIPQTDCKVKIMDRKRSG